MIHSTLIHLTIIETQGEIGTLCLVGSQWFNAVCGWIGVIESWIWNQCWWYEKFMAVCHVGDYLSAEDVEGGAALVARSIGHVRKGGIWAKLLGHSHHLPPPIPPKASGVLLPRTPFLPSFSLFFPLMSSHQSLLILGTHQVVAFQICRSCY